MTRTRVLIADDHRIFLDGLERLLQPEYEVVGKASSGESLLALAAEHDPELIVTDDSMPDLTGIEAVVRLRRVALKARVVILTMHEDAAYATEAIEGGASAYVLKRAASSELLTAMRHALDGHTWVSPAVAGGLRKRPSGGRARGGGRRLQALSHEEQLVADLSDRQRYILAALVDGMIAKEIARRIGVSRKTVEYHKYKLMRALAITTTAELVRFVLRHRLDRNVPIPAKPTPKVIEAGPSRKPRWKRESVAEAGPDGSAADRPKPSPDEETPDAFFDSIADDGPGDRFDGPPGDRPTPDRGH